MVIVYDGDVPYTYKMSEEIKKINDQANKKVSEFYLWVYCFFVGLIYYFNFSSNPMLSTVLCASALFFGAFVFIFIKMVLKETLSNMLSEKISDTDTRNFNFNHYFTSKEKKKSVSYLEFAEKEPKKFNENVLAHIKKEGMQSDFN